VSDPILSADLSYGEILKIYQNYSDYDLEESADRAKIFIKAGRMLLGVALRRSGQSSRAEEIEVEPEILERQVKAAITWYAAHREFSEPVRQYIPASDWRDE